MSELKDFEQWKVDVTGSKEEVHFSDTAAEVDIDKFHLTEKIKTLIVNGWQGNGHKSRSEADEAVIVALLSKGATDDEIKAIFQSSAIGEKFREKGASGDRYLAHSIGRAKEYISSAESKAGGATGEGSANNSAHSNYSSAAEIQNLTDLGNARTFAAMHAGNVLFSAERGKWILWGGRRWEWDTTGEIFDRALQTLVSFYSVAATQQSEDERKALVRHALKTEARGRIEAMLKLAQGLPQIRTDLERFDTDPWLFNVENGTLDLSAGKLKPHKREDFITKIAPVKFEPEARSPVFGDFLDAVTMHRSDLKAYLARAAGYTLTGLTTEQVIFLLIGSGANGKTTLVNALLYLLGDYGQQIDIAVLMENYRSDASYHIAELQGARLAAACESEVGKKLAISLVKQMSGGDWLVGRRPFEMPVRFLPNFKLWVSTNHRPRIPDTSESIWRRLRVIPFDAYFPEGKQDPDFTEKLKGEGASILAWAVRGCAEWRSARLGTPDEVRSKTAEYRHDEDRLGAFLEDCTERDEDGWETAKDIYAAYTEWCKENGEKPLTQKEVGEQLAERSFQSGRTKKLRTWKGLRLTTP